MSTAPPDLLPGGERIVRQLDCIGELVYEEFGPGHLAVFPAPKPSQPYGMCQCGCGRRAPLATRTRMDRGGDQVKGEPVRFLTGHAPRDQHRPLFIINGITGCWVWWRARNSKGYGITRKEGSGNCAHRMMWEKSFGPVPSGLELDHLCMNRACVNPAHLEPVSHAENVRRGVMARLTVDAVEEIRASTESNAALAVRFGVTRDHVGDIRRGKTWVAA